MAAKWELEQKLARMARENADSVARGNRIQEEFDELLKLLAPEASRIKPKYRDPDARRAAWSTYMPDIFLSNKEIIEELRQEIEREKFDALKPAEKADYLFEKLYGKVE